MGGNLETIVYPFEDPKDLAKWWAERQDDDRQIHGSDTYSGEIGSLSGGVNLIRRQPFKDLEAACDYIGDHHDKGSAAMAVPFVGKVEVPFIALANAQKKQREAEERLENLIQTTLEAMKKTKSKTIGCKGCGSSISRAYLKLGRDCAVVARCQPDAIPCPVCRRDLTTPSDGKRIEAARTAVRKAAANCYELRDRKEIRKGTNWLVGGWCRS